MMDFQTALEALREAVAFEVSRAPRQTISELNNAVRRLRLAESREEWIRTLTEAAAQFCGQAEFFPVSARGMSVEGAEIPVPPAFANAVESRDTVVAAATAGELSLPVLVRIGEVKRVWLVPVLVKDKAIGVLCAVPAEGQDDVSGVELVAALGSASVVAGPETTVESKPAEFIRIAGVPEPAVAKAQPQGRPGWNDLGKAEQAIHLRAQRFARSAAAELVLLKGDAVKKGRAAANVYGNLREEIDAAREAFRQQYIDACPSMVDYLHLELVRTLALDDTRTMGVDYPGPLP